MAKVKCVKFKELICPKTKRRMIFKKPVSVIFTQRKRGYWLFECQEAKALWDYGKSKEQCQEYFTSMAFDFYDIGGRKTLTNEFRGHSQEFVVIDDCALWADCCAQWRERILDVQAV